MSLAIRRRPGQKIFLHLKQGSNIEELLKYLTTAGIEIKLGEVRDTKAVILIDAPEAMLILREELMRD